jgi:fused signal recognition particle receptor
MKLFRRRAKRDSETTPETPSADTPEVSREPDVDSMASPAEDSPSSTAVGSTAAPQDAALPPESQAESPLAAAAPSPFVEDEAPAPASPAPDNNDTVADKPEGFYARLKRGLSRTSSQLASGLGDLFLGKKAIDDDLLEELESQLLMADLGVEATQRVIDDLTQRVSRKELSDADALMTALQDALFEIVSPCEVALEPVGHKPFVILVVGVNGAGKTTTIGKLAHRYKAEGRSVMLAAGDTFRAAAVEQLQVWGERNDVPVVAQHTGADSASVLYDALQAATAREADVLIADTAGRLQNKAHLMDELAKVVRVLKKFDPSAPHEVLLVLDAGTGQNAVSQAEQFNEAVGVTGVVLTKLDGTARGGVIFAVAQRLARPIRYIGVGESATDLRPFVARDFVRALFDRGE